MSKPPEQLTVEYLLKSQSTKEVWGTGVRLTGNQ